MAKRYKLALFLMFILLVAVAVVVVSGALDINKKAEHRPQGTNAVTEQAQDYTELFQTVTDVALPVLKTRLPGVYYTIDQKGDVRFYEREDGNLKALAETGTFEVKAECGSETLPAEIHYLEKDGKTWGCGLFSNVLYPDVNVYSYGFFEVTEPLPAQRADSLLMMIDVDSSRFYSADKIYSEIYTLNKKDHSVEYFLSEEHRTTDMDARPRTDYKMFTDAILDQQTADRTLFFSSRNYVSYDESGKVDVMTSGGSGLNIDNVVYLENAASLNFWRLEDGVYFFRAQPEGGFALMKYAGGTESEVVKTFEGDLKKDYLISGRCLLRKDSGEIYNVYTGETRRADYSDLRVGFTADLFAASPKGDFVVLRGANTENVACCIATDLITGVTRAYTDDMFGYIAAMNVEDDGGTILSLANGKSGTSFYQLVAVQ